MELGAVGTDEDGHYQGAAGETKLHGHRHPGEAEWYASDDDAEEDADEHRDEIGLVETFHGVAEAAGEIVDVLELAHDGEAVAHLEAQARAGEEVDARTVDAGDVETVGRAEPQRAEARAVELSLGDEDAPRHHRALLHLPFLLYLRADEAVEDLLVVDGADHEHEVAELKGVVGTRNKHRAVGLLDTRDHEIAGDQGMKLLEREACYQVVGDLEGHDMRGEGGVVFLVFHLLDLPVDIDPEELLHEDHGDYDAHYAERVGRGVSHRHLLAGPVGRGVDLKHRLLRGAEPRGIGDGTAHHADELDDGDVARGATLNEIDGEHYHHIEGDAEHGEAVHPDAPLLKRGEEARADLHTDGEDEEDESELTKEMKSVGLHEISEMAHNDAHKQDERDAEGDTENLDLSEINAGKDDK